MAKPTREQVVERGYTIIPYLGYYWGGWPAQNPITRVYWNKETDTIEKSSDGNLIGCDCSGFVNWCWCIGRAASGSFGPKGYYGGSNFHYGGSGNTYEERFPGIQPGDVLWRDGHVGLYVGNNSSLEANRHDNISTTTYLNGCNLYHNRPFVGYSSFQQSFAGDYDPDEDDVLIHNFYPNSSADPPPNPTPPGDLSNWDLDWIYRNWDYTKRYPLMKLYRRF